MSRTQSDSFRLSVRMGHKLTTSTYAASIRGPFTPVLWFHSKQTYAFDNRSAAVVPPPQFWPMVTDRWLIRIMWRSPYSTGSHPDGEKQNWLVDASKCPGPLP